MADTPRRQEGGLGPRLRRLSLIHALRAMVRVPPAATVPTSPVTVIVPARNEERDIEACVRSLLNQSYANYDVVVVDDRSEDATPVILRRLGAESPRLRVMQTPPLPPGWVGQTWAWETAAGQATAEWLLFTDADTQHQPGMLAAVIAFAETHGLDMLSLMMRHKLSSFWERALLPPMLAIFLQAGGSLEEVNDPSSPAAKAVGGFMLVRRTVYEALGGFGPIRGEVLNDTALAKLVKGRGYRFMLANGADWVQIRMYHSLGEVWTGFSKNVFFGAGQNVLRVLGGAVLLLGLALGPFVLMGVGIAWLAEGMGGTWPRLALVFGGLGILWLMARGIGVAWGTEVPWVYGLLHPLGVVVFVGILLNSAFLIVSGRGVKWRGRRYHGAAGGG
jgi:chlorobactene glucosyltransferase